MNQEAKSLLLDANHRTRNQRNIRIALGCIAMLVVGFATWLSWSKGWHIALQAGGIASTFLGAGFLASGILPKPKTIIELSQTKVDLNLALLDSLLVNRLTALIGLIFLIVGYILQGVGLAL